MPAEHHLKCWPELFEAVLKLRKPFEARKDDRGFEVGDTLVLQEWLPQAERYTGRILRRTVTYILRGGRFGVEPGYAILGIQPPAQEIDARTAHAA